MFAVIQYRLYQAGHALDPDAPLVGVEGFTPPVLGGYAVANISGFAWFGPGGYMVAVAVALLAGAYRCREARPRSVTSRDSFASGSNAGSRTTARPRREVTDPRDWVSCTSL